MPIPNNVTEQIGRVESVSNEICLISGLHSVALNNLIEFSSGEQGMVLGFNKTDVQTIILGNSKNIKKGDIVKVIDESLKIGVSDKLIGRIIDPLGKPLDQKGEVEATVYRHIDSPAKKVNERDHITKPLCSGFMIIDSQIPIGLGQRELLVGEQKVKKSDTAVAIICNQAKANPDLINIYVTIDTETTAVKRRIDRLKEANVLKNSIVMVSRSSDSSSLNYIAPMSAVSIAEVFASQGRDVLIVFDNLTRHAKIYRQISLLLDRSPGREAYPGDIFYLHARLLERCGSFNKAAGGGSITALPIVETQGEEITDYITTNLMSITDGHILFKQSIANQGIRPAIDSGFSVSRIGGRAQPPIVRALSDDLKNTIIRYHEVEKYMMFGSELQRETLETIELGKRVYRIFNQNYSELYSPLEEALLLYLITSKKILAWDLEQAVTLRNQLIEYIQNDKTAQSISSIMAEKDMDKNFQTMGAFIDDFAKRPETVKQTEKTPQSAAEKETIVDLLHDNTGEKNADSGKSEKRA